MTQILIVLGIGAVAVGATLLVPAIEGWGPLFALCTAGGAHLTWIVGREGKDARRHEPSGRRAA
ncbi:MAG: hypothetical protein HY824_17760 [Acidobacteria bacterium]|nr:hypothetical protein [Acidobacteriota bacterium]